MRPRLGWLWGALTLAGVAAVVSAQSLGELAAKEQARREKERQKNGGASKVITESDLRGSGRGTFSNAGSTESPAAEASPSPAASDGARPAAAQKEKSPDELRAEQEMAWRQGVQQAQAEVTRLAAQLDRLQQSLNDLTAPMYGSGRAALLAQFETTRTDLAAARQKVTDLEEDGRRNSYRAGS